MTPLQIRPIENYELDSWDEFLLHSENGTIYHSSVWKRIIDSSYGGGQYTIIGAFDDNGITGGFCALTRKRLGVETAVTPLCTPYTGFVTGPPAGADSHVTTNEIIRAMAAYLRRYRYQHLQCAPGPLDHSILTEAGYFITPRKTLEINLRLPKEELWSGFNGNVRRNIKKAQKSGFEITDQWDPGRGFALFCETFSRHGHACPVSEKFFQEICSGSVLDDYRRRYCAWQDGKLMAYIIALRFGGAVYYELAASDPEALRSGVSSLLVWELLRDHLGGSWETFDFVGANNPSIARFKENFNPTVKHHLLVERCASRRIGFGRGVKRWLSRRS